MNGTFMCSLLCRCWGFHITQDTFRRIDNHFSEFLKIFLPSPSIGQKSAGWQPTLEEDLIFFFPSKQQRTIMCIVITCMRKFLQQK